MVPKATVPCTACNSTGRVPHEKRTINGVVDPWDYQDEETCTKCGGSGRMIAPGPDPDAPAVAAMKHGDCCV